MKFSAIVSALSLLPATLASAIPPSDPVDIEAITDHYMFEIQLDGFISLRAQAASNSSGVIWDSNGCSFSPDNPLGFDFAPACIRHDFGYRNYRHQGRFTRSAKGAIDWMFLQDLYHQCKSETMDQICRVLAQGYFVAVMEFGGADATKDEKEGEGGSDDVANYKDKLAAYNELLAKATEDGVI